MLRTHPEGEFRSNNSQEPQRQYTWKQTLHIAAYKQMGQLIAADLAQEPALRDEISRLVHETPLHYRGIIHHLLTGQDLTTAVNHPFIRAFEATPQCSAEEKDLLTKLRDHTATTTTPLATSLREFRQWVTTKEAFIAKGLQWCVRHSGVITPLTAEEIKYKEGEARKRWREENPEQWEIDHKKLVQAVIDAATPTTYTEKVRTQVQTWFDQGYDYPTVSLLLKGIGIEVTALGVKKAVGRFDDLHYTPGERKTAERKGFVQAAKAIFGLSASRAKTIEILELLGHNASKTNRALNELGLRERINWDAPIEIDEKSVKLSEVVLGFIAGCFPTIQQEYQAFISYLKEKGVDQEISLMAYTGARRRLLTSQKRKSNQ